MAPVVKIDDKPKLEGSDKYTEYSRSIT